MKRSNIVTLWCAFLVIEVVAFVNAYLVNLKGGTIDAVRFQEAATRWAIDGEFVFAVNSEFFVQYLGLIYRFFGPHEFIATQFGILAALISVLIFIRLLYRLSLPCPDLAILAFLLWPSMLLRVTTTLREPYMILAIILAFYALVRFSQTRHLGYAVISLAALLVGALFHKAIAVMVPFALFAISAMLLSAQRGLEIRKTSLLGFGMFVIGLLILVEFAATPSEVRGLKPLQSLLVWDKDHITNVLDYKTGREFRTTYSASLQFGSPLVFLRSGVEVVIAYIFMPFPWFIRHPLDLFAFSEVLFRLGGIFLIIRFGFTKPGMPRALRPLWILTALLICIWAAGTSNYGTGSRHHLTTNWVFLLVYIACFSVQRPMTTDRLTV